MSSAEEEKEQSLIGHLVELRARLLRAVLAVLAVFIGLIPFANRIYTLLAEPLRAKLPAGAQMVAIDVASPFFAPIKLAFCVALMLSMPIILYQAWAFVAPGLYRHEQKLARPLLVSAVLLFYAGCAFAYFLVLPVVFGFLTGVAPEGVAVMTDISRYLDFVLVLFLAFGFSFEVPVAVVILVALGWVSVAQLMLAIPMCLLYELGLIVARALVRRRVQAPADPAP